MIRTILTFTALLFCITGCSGFFNPYSSEFRCQNVGNDGRCLSTSEAYTESKEGPPDLIPQIKTTKTPEEVYNKNRYSLMTDLVKDPTPPVVVPPEVVRILILPYTDKENSMYDMRFSYFFATDPKWQFSITEED